MSSKISIIRIARPGDKKSLKKVKIMLDFLRKSP